MVFSLLLRRLKRSYLLSSCKRVLRLSIKPEVFTYTGWHPSIAVLLLKSAEARCVWSGIEYNVYSDLKLFLHPTIQGVRMLLVLMTKILHLWRISWMTSWSGMYQGVVLISSDFVLVIFWHAGILRLLFNCFVFLESVNINIHVNLAKSLTNSTTWKPIDLLVNHIHVI